MERKRVLVAFGDILGFGGWMIRASNTPEVTHKLIEDVYVQFEKFAATAKCHAKFLGDGLMLVKEMSNGHNCRMTREFLIDAYKFAFNVNKIITASYPHPDGFRLRIASGHVWKRSSVTSDRRRNNEYVGYSINLAQRLLEVSPQTLAVCHESIVEIISEKKGILTFERMGDPKERPRGVDFADLQGLYCFWINDENKSGA